MPRWGLRTEEGGNTSGSALCGDWRQRTEARLAEDAWHFCLVFCLRWYTKSNAYWMQMIISIRIQCSLFRHIEALNYRFGGLGKTQLLLIID